MATITGVTLPAFDNTLGAVLVGGFVSVFLYGVTCLQTFVYFQRYPKERQSMKLLVVALWMLDTFDAILTSHVCYFYMVSNFANPLAILTPVWSIKLHVFVTSLSNFVVRGMFARRVYNLSHHNILMTGGIAVISTIDLVVGTVITVKAFGIPSFAGLAKVSNLFYLNFASNVSADLSVAIVLTYYLWVSRTGFGKTDSLLVTLIFYTINTGMLTAIDASAGLICYAVMPTNLIFIAFYLNLSKLYVNSYLASLNARKALLTSMKSDNGLVSIHLSRVSNHMPSFRPITEGDTSGQTTTGRSTQADKDKASQVDSEAVETPIDALPLGYADYEDDRKREPRLPYGPGNDRHADSYEGFGGYAV